MNISRLKTFIVVAETGSLSRASDRLRLAQPALSRQIKLLEHEIGRELFSRSNRGMEMTDVGQELFDRVSGLVAQLERSMDDARSFRSEPSGQVALGMIPSISPIIAGRIALRVSRELPSVSLRIVEAYGGHLTGWLHAGNIDLSLLYGPAEDLHLRVTPLLREELVLVSRAGSDVATESPLSVSQVSQLKLVLPSRPHGLRMVVENAARTARVKLNVEVEADSYGVLKNLVEAGVGHTVLPMSAIGQELKLGTLCGTSLKAPTVWRHVVLALPAGGIESRATRAVAVLLLDEVRQLLRNRKWIAQPSEELLALQDAKVPA